MNERERFDRTLETLEVPRVGDLQHPKYVRASILSARRSAALTIWFILIPAYILICTLMKAAFGAEPHLFSVFDGIVRALEATAAGRLGPPVLLLGLPVLAILLNLAALARTLRATPGGDVWSVAARRPINVALVLLGVLVSSLYLLYVMFRI